MRILVAIKSVPDITQPRVITDGRLERGVLDTLNELDEYAIEEAVQLAEQTGARTTALTMGPEFSEAVLHTALQMGVDEGVLVCDSRLAASDARATALILKAALQRLNETQPIDLVLLGASSLDGMTQLVPPLLAKALEWPLVPLVTELKLSADKALSSSGADSIAAAHSEPAGTSKAVPVIEPVPSVQQPEIYQLEAVGKADQGLLSYQGTLPAVVSVTGKLNTPRIPDAKLIAAARNKPIVTYSLADLIRKNGEEVGLTEQDLEQLQSKISLVNVQTHTNDDKIIYDDGTAAEKLAQYLYENR